MVLEELEERYGPLLAEEIRQSVTLEEFHRLDIDELSAYFALRVARTYQEFVEHEDDTPPEDGRVLSSFEYQAILRRRWQKAEDLAQRILTADRQASTRQTFV
ncbi:MAG: hypothetical protein AB7E52_06180 [Bdellovibrionales bacterium]